VDYILDRKDVQPAWHAFTHHDFVEKMGDGTLSTALFKNYMIQDYLYLVCHGYGQITYSVTQLTCFRYNSREPTLWLVTRRRTSRTSRL
jgi:hypothetical protein